MIKNADYSSAGHYSCIANNNVDMQLKKNTERCKTSWGWSVPSSSLVKLSWVKLSYVKFSWVKIS